VKQVHLIAFILSAIFAVALCGGRAQAAFPAKIKAVLDETKPLQFPRGDRLPLYVWPAMDAVGETDAETEQIIRDLDSRGIGLISSWDAAHPEKSLDQALRVAAIQKRLGLMVNVDVSSCMDGFFNGDPTTAHVTADGKTFFDTSFTDNPKMGCPFALAGRYAEMRARFETFVKAYKARRLPLDFVFTDWEIDGPIEWNGAWEASKNCARCREHVKHIEDFNEFQNTLRAIRCDMQREVYSKTIKRYFPDALIGNYGVYPSGGYRFWYDYYENQPTDDMPYRTDQKAKYRQWFDEFPLTGYTYAMPVAYTWYPTFDWYRFPNTDYRWFYNMLLSATDACRNRPKNTPVITFVHWHTTAPPNNPDPNVKQLSEEKYQELLWHMLLRGTDGLFLWCTSSESPKEVKLLQEVYADSLKYREFLDKGKPITFDVPTWQGPVISGLKLNLKVLIRRTDFDDATEPVKVTIDGQTISVPRVDGKCQIITLKEKERYVPMP